MVAVTVPVFDVGTAPIGTDVVGKAVFTLDRAAMATDGLHVRKRVEALANSSGIATVDLLPWSQMVDPVPYRLHIEWLNANGYEPGSGFNARSEYEKPLYVPDAGGTVQSFTVPTFFAGMITGFGPPSPEIAAGNVPYVDVSGVNPVFYFPAA